LIAGRFSHIVGASTLNKHKLREQNPPIGKLKPCPDCGHQVSDRAGKCPQCGGPLWHKTAKEAYGSWSGLGLLDLIPGIRDLPFGVRFAIMLVVVVLTVLILVPMIVS